MSITYCKSLEEIKSAISIKKNIISVEGRSVVADAINYFKKLNFERKACNVGIVIGFFAFAPIFFGGIGEKIVHSKYRKYIYYVSDDMDKCIVIRKAYLIGVTERFPRDMEESLMKAHVSEEELETYLELNKREIKRVLKLKKYGAIVKDKNFRMLSKIADYCAGVGIILEIDELWKELSNVSNLRAEKM